MYGLLLVVLLVGQVEMPSDELILERLAVAREKAIVAAERDVAFAQQALKNGDVARPRGMQQLKGAQAKVKALRDPNQPWVPTLRGVLDLTKGDIFYLDTAISVTFRVDEVVDGDTAVFSLNDRVLVLVEGIDTTGFVDRKVIQLPLPLLVAMGTTKLHNRASEPTVWVLKKVASPPKQKP